MSEEGRGERLVREGGWCKISGERVCLYIRFALVHRALAQQPRVDAEHDLQVYVHQVRAFALCG